MYKSGDAEPGPAERDAAFAARTEMILTWPTTTIKMKVKQAAQSLEIHHKYSIVYQGGIGVGWNTDNYTRLKELKEAHKARMRYHGLEVEVTTEPSSPAVEPAQNTIETISAQPQQSASDTMSLGLSAPLKYIPSLGPSEIDKPYLDATGKGTLNSPLLKRRLISRFSRGDG